MLAFWYFYDDLDQPGLISTQLSKVSIKYYYLLCLSFIGFDEVLRAKFWATYLYEELSVSRLITKFDFPS